MNLFKVKDWPSFKGKLAALALEKYVQNLLKNDENYLNSPSEQSGFTSIRKSHKTNVIKKSPNPWSAYQDVQGFCRANSMNLSIFIWTRLTNLVSFKAK